MITEAFPEIGTWYHYPAKSQKFMVTAVDDHTETIEIQYFDGTIDEIDLESWYLLDVERVETPEDWTGPMDNIEKDDLNPVGTEMLREDWDESYDESRDERHGGDDQDYEEDNFVEDEEDEEER